MRVKPELGGGKIMQVYKVQLVGNSYKVQGRTAGLGQT